MTAGPKSGGEGWARTVLEGAAEGESTSESPSATTNPDSDSYMVAEDEIVELGEIDQPDDRQHDDRQSDAETTKAADAMANGKKQTKGSRSGKSRGSQAGKSSRSRSSNNKRGSQKPKVDEDAAQVGDDVTAGEAKDGQAKDGAVTDGQAKDGAGKDSAVKDGGAKDSSVKDGGAKDSSVKDNDVKGSEASDSGADGQPASGDSAKAGATKSGDAVDDRGLDGASTEQAEPSPDESAETDEASKSATSDQSQSSGDPDLGAAASAGTEEGEIDVSVEHLVADLERVSAERDQYLDASRRLQAEFENYKKQVSKREATARERANDSLVEEMLPVLDAFDGAVTSGVDAVVPMRTALLDSLAKHGLERIDPETVPFDPNLHEAVMHEDDADVDGPVVAEVLRAGYSWKGRVLRPAMVKTRG